MFGLSECNLTSMFNPAVTLLRAEESFAAHGGGPSAATDEPAAAGDRGALAATARILDSLEELAARRPLCSAEKVQLFRAQTLAVGRLAPVPATDRLAEEL